MSRLQYDVNDEPIAGYRLVDFLGKGSFGEVWKAIDTESDIYVALKIIDLSRSPSALKELKGLGLVRNLRHPNLVPIYTARIKDRNGHELALNKADEVRRLEQLSELVIAMGLGDRSLSARLRQHNHPTADPNAFRGLPLDEVIGYMAGAAKGIDYLNKADHGLGAGDGSIVHCDIKPDNLMIVAGEVQVADCGVAVVASGDGRQTRATCSLSYSPPELLANRPQAGSDQYSLAISYYELRTGQLPMDRNVSQWEAMVIHAEGKLKLDHPALTAGEIQVLKWATAVQPRARYASCADMVKQLERSARGRPPLPPGEAGTAPVPDLTLWNDVLPVFPAPDALTRTSDAILLPLSQGDQFDGFRDAAAVHPEAAPPQLSPEDWRAALAPTATVVPADASSRLWTGDGGTPPPSPERPSLLLDNDDPLGPKYGTVMLDSELKIILGSPPPTVASPLSGSDPVVVAEPLEPASEPSGPSVAMDEELSTLRSPAPLGGTAKAVEAAPFAVTKTPAVEPAPAGGRAAKILFGVLLLGGLAAGGVYLGTTGGDPPTPPDPPPVTQGATPPAVKPGDTLADDLKTLEVAPDKLEQAAAALWQKYPDPESQQAVGRKLAEVGRNDPASRGPALAALGKDNRFADRVVESADRAEVVRWQADALTQGDYAAAREAVGKLAAAAAPPPPDVAAAQTAVETLQKAADAAAARFGPAWKTEAAAPAVANFLAAAAAWSPARAKPSADVKPLGDFLLQATDAPAGFAVEYLRLSAAVPVEDVRKVRDRVVTWPGLSPEDRGRIDDEFQAAVAAFVRDQLKAAEPNWDRISKACGPDAAQGWAKLADVERRLADPAEKAAALLTQLDEAEKLPAAEATAADKRTMLAFLRAVATKDDVSADRLQQLFDPPAPPPILTTPARQVAAAGVLGPRALALVVWDKTLDDLLGDKSNPYPKSARGLAWAKTAYRLDGDTHGEWAYALALLADRADDRAAVQAVTHQIKLNDTALADAELPVGLAYLQLQLRDPKFPAANRPAVAALFARVAYRLLERSFQNCRTLKDVSDLQKKLIPKIDAVVEEGLAKADPKSVDHLSLRVARVRSALLLKAQSPDRQVELGKDLDDLIARMGAFHPDKADAFALRAYVTLQGFSGHIPDFGRKLTGRWHDAPEADRRRAWQSIADDAEQATGLDPTNRIGNTVRALQIATEFNACPPYAAPQGARKADFVGQKALVAKALEAFKLAADAMPTRKYPAFWSGYAAFCLAAAEDLARAEAVAEARTLLADADAAARKANEQRSDVAAGTSELDRQQFGKRYDEARLLGGVAAAKAWINPDEPPGTAAAEYAKALQLLKFDGTLVSSQEFEGVVDFARVVLRGVRVGAVAGNRLAEAEAVLKRQIAAAEKRAQDAKTPRDAKAAALAHQADGELVKALIEVYKEEARLEQANLAGKARDEAVTAVQSAANALEAAVKKYPDPHAKAMWGFVPDYLRGRAAARANRPGDSAAAYKKSYDLIATAKSDGTLRLDDSFAVKSLAHGLIDGGPADRQRRAALLDNLAKRYEWLLTARDRELIKAARQK